MQSGKRTACGLSLADPRVDEVIPRRPGLLPSESLPRMTRAIVRSPETRVDTFNHLDGAMPWFAGWGTLALVNAGLAQGKNRSGLLWFALSLLFGPLATLALVLLPKVRQTLF